jgi:hypothetical protein
MASPLLAFAIVAGAVLLVGYAIARPKPRRAKASRDGSNFGDTGSYDGGDSGSHHGWGGHDAATGHSAGTSDGDGGGGDSGGGSD